jgi:toxin ParE1/3/4
MASVRSPQADSDLDNIWYYVATESGSVEIADRLIDSITERFFLLANFPNLGRRRDEDLRPDLRSFLVGEYVILYRLRDEDVLILRVLRGSRNIEALFGH